MVGQSSGGEEADGERYYVIFVIRLVHGCLDEGLW